jgi:hypothetical protein
MLPRTLLRRRRTREQADRKTRPWSQARPVENQAHAEAIAAKLRAMIPCSTDPAWLERMAREVETKAYLR